MLTNSHNLFYTLSILPTRTMDGFCFNEALHKLVDESTNRVLREANERHNRRLIEIEKSHKAIIAEMRENHRNDSAEANRRLIEMEKSHKSIIAEMRENHRTVSAEANRRRIETEKSHKAIIAEMRENHRTVSAEAKLQINKMKESQQVILTKMEEEATRQASTKKKLSQCQMECSSNKRCLQEQFEDLCKVKRSRTSETNLNEVALALEEVAQRVRTRSESPDADLQPFAFFGTADDDELRRGAELCREIDVNHLGQGGMDHYAQGWVISGSDDRSPTDVDAQGGVAISGCDAPCNDLEGSFVINNVSYVGYHKGRGGVPKCPHLPQGPRNSKSSNATFVIFKEDKKKKWGRWVCGGCPRRGTDNILYHCCWRTKGGEWISEKTPMFGTFECQTD